MTAAHPCLYVGLEQLTALRERVKRAPFAVRWERLRAHADACLDQAPAGPAPQLNCSRAALGVVASTAFAYLITGQRRYGARAKAELAAQLQADTWCHPGWRHFNHGADLVTGERCLAAALAYDWCHDLFSEEERCAVTEAVVRLGLEPYLVSVAEQGDWWVDNPVSNWCGVVHGGCGTAGLAFAAESPRAAQAADLAGQHVRRFLRAVTLADGDGHEGIMYWRYGMVFANYFLTANPRWRVADADLSRSYVDKLAGYWDIYLHGPDRTYANFNNMPGRRYQGLYGENPAEIEGGPSAMLCALFESVTPGGDPLLLWGADNGGGLSYFQGVSPFWFLWRRDAPPAGPRPPLQEAVLFRGGGHAVLQSPTLWWAMNGGWTSDRSHYNLDLGTFILVAHGERFVYDPGYGFVATGDHSTLLFAGQDQPRNVAGHWVCCGAGEGFAYAACDLSAVNPDRPVVRWVRHAVMVGGDYLVLLDDVQLRGRCAVEWRLQSERPIAADATTAPAVIRGDRALLHVLAAAPAGAPWSAAVREIQNAHQVKLQVHTLSLQPGEAVDETVFVTVLYPLRAGDGAPEARWSPEGQLEVCAAARKDRLEFERHSTGWRLARVNGASAADIPSGAERSLRACNERVSPHPSPAAAGETRSSTDSTY